MEKFPTLKRPSRIPFVAHVGWLAWPIVLVWGGAGGSLYTLGSMTASAASGALLQWSPTWGFPLVLASVALVGWIALLRTRHRGQI